MRSPESAPWAPLLARELRALLARWHLWAALALVGLMQAAAIHSAAPLEGAAPVLWGALAAAWWCALPVVLACGTADDQGASAALLLQLGHGPARRVLAKTCAAGLGALVLALPTVAMALLLIMRGSPVELRATSTLVLLLVSLALVALALWLAALVEAAGWAALVTLLGTLGALWLDERVGALDVMKLARAGSAPVAALVEVVVIAGTLLVLAAVASSPVASGERRVVRLLVTLALGGALFAVASQLSGELGVATLVDARARGAQATALVELRGAALALGALFFAAGATLAWRRRP